MNRRWWIGAALLALMGATFFGPTVRAARKSTPMLAHMVYFTLKEPTESNKEALVAACHKYLSGHDGTVFFAAGTLAEELDRDVNDQDFDVALQLVFDGKEAHDTYQTHQRHLDFIKVAQPMITKVRVFDSYVTKE